MGGEGMSQGNRRLAALWAAVLLLFASCIPLAGAVPVRAAAPEEPVLRVAFPDQPGLTMVDAAGNYSGYTYEYLMEMAQYTGWKYEFVQVEGDINQQLTVLLEMLQAGELDLMGAMQDSPALQQQFEYPGNSYGTSYTVLAALKENTAITTANYKTQKGLRVAAQAGAVSRRQELEDFCQRNDFSPELVEYASGEEMQAALRGGQVDLMLVTDMAMEDDCIAVATFAPRPFYIVTTKGKREVAQQIDAAIGRINEADPYYNTTLYEKYFGNDDSELRLNQEELAYLQGADALRVAVVAGKEPLQSYNGKTGEFGGITVDFLRYAAQQTGLELSFVYAESQQELKRLTTQGEVDLVAAIPYNYSVAREYNVAMTQPYLSSQIVMVTNKHTDSDELEDKTLAMAAGFEFQNMYGSPVKRYASVQECLDAVERGDADYCFGNSYAIQYFVNSINYRNLIQVPQSSLEQRVCVGVVRPADQNLLTILNKVEKSIADSELQSIIYRNASGRQPFTIAGAIHDHPVGALGLTALAAALVIAGLVWFQHGRARAAQRIALENQRYQMLSNLSNESIFEYDFGQDRLELRGKTIQHAGGQSRYEHVSAIRDSEDEGDLQFYRALLEGAEQQEIQCGLAGGGRRWIRVTAAVVRDNAGVPAYTVGKLVDVQDEVEARKVLEERAQRDGLTGAYNAAACRRLIEGRLQKEEGGTLLIVDLDHFKCINDAYGHYAGDQVLVGLVKILQKTFRREDIVGRLGGDEFIVYMQGVTERPVLEEKCGLLNERVRRMDHGIEGLTVRISIGGAVAGGQGYEELYQLADKALYLAKNNGRDGYRLL